MTHLLPSHVRRGAYGRRLEPVGDGVLHGAGQDAEAFRAYCADVAPHTPALFMTYVSVKDDVPAYFNSLTLELKRYAPKVIVPQIGLIMTGGADTDHHPEQHYEREVAEGRYDQPIDALCAGLRRLDRPAYLRIGFEFNGPWFGYEPEAYKAAWMRIAATLRRHQLQEVAAVWCYCPLPSAREADHGRDRDYLPYYPGDEWVDWWAIDLFSVGDFTADNTLAFMADARHHWKRTPHGYGTRASGIGAPRHAVGCGWSRKLGHHRRRRERAVSDRRDRCALD